jgi:hypothetical protein
MLCPGARLSGGDHGLGIGLFVIRERQRLGELFEAGDRHVRRRGGTDGCGQRKGKQGNDGGTHEPVLIHSN